VVRSVEVVLDNVSVCCNLSTGFNSRCGAEFFS